MIYDSLAINDIRKYVWAKIVEAGLLDPDDYRVDGIPQPLVPIIPSQQVPEFVNLLTGKAFIIYEYKVYPTKVQWWMTDETATFYIDTPNFDLSNRIVNLLHDLFRRFDESAGEINDYLAGQTSFIFHNTSIGAIDSALPSKVEGGFQEAIVEVDYTYSRNTGSSGRF